jgi:hypothetical protein
MTRVSVESGICGFTSTIEVAKLSAKMVRVDISSDCEMVSKLGEKLHDLEWRNALKLPENPLLCKCAHRYIRHAACPVPVAILKAIEVEVGMALAKDVAIHFDTANHSQSNTE